MEAWLTEVDMVLACVAVYGLEGLDVSLVVRPGESWSGAERVAAVRNELEAEAREGGVMRARAGAVPRSRICAVFRGVIFAKCLNMAVKGDVMQNVDAWVYVYISFYPRFLLAVPKSSSQAIQVSSATAWLTRKLVMTRRFSIAKVDIRTRGQCPPGSRASSPP